MEDNVEQSDEMCLFLFLHSDTIKHCLLETSYHLFSFEIFSCIEASDSRETPTARVKVYNDADKAGLFPKIGGVINNAVL